MLEMGIGKGEDKRASKPGTTRVTATEVTD